MMYDLATTALDENATKFTRRRHLLKLAGFGALSCLPMPCALAYLPRKQIPTPLEDLIMHLTLVIYTGRLRRQVWITNELIKKLYTEGAAIKKSEFRLLGLSEIDIDHAPAGFFEIEEAKPIFKNPSAISLPLHRGRIYCDGYNYREGIMEAEKFVGQEAIFLFDGLRKIGIGKNTFQKPKYIGVTGGYWSDCLPIPMSQLERVAFIAKQAGFVVPSRYNSVLL